MKKFWRSNLHLSKINTDKFNEEKFILENKSLLKYLKKSPILFENMKELVPLNLFFKNILYYDLQEENIFSSKTFIFLKDLIVSENPLFNPLRDGYSSREYESSNWFLVPSLYNSLSKELNETETACSTYEGDFIFSKEYCERLCRYALFFNLKTKDSKYISNGGIIPDYYCLIETAIMHELLHISYGDHFYTNHYKEHEPIVHNLVGDYIINYNLKKKDFLLPPDFLYSDYLNYDKFSDIKELRTIVSSELIKLGSLDKQEDNILKSDHQFTKTPDSEINLKYSEKQKEHLLESKDYTSIQEKIKEVSISFDFQSIDNHQKNFQFSYEKVNRNWKESFKLLIPAFRQLTEFSYSKMNNRAISNISLLEETNCSAIKPGELLIEEETIDLLIVIDHSHSVWNSINEVYLNIIELIVSNQKKIKSLTFILFDIKIEIFDLEFKSHKIKNKGNNKIFTYDEFFNSSIWGGGTIFNEDLVTLINDYANNNYSLAFFSDEDLINKDNRLMFEKSLSHLNKNNVPYIFICADQESFISFKKEEIPIKHLSFLHQSI